MKYVIFILWFISLLQHYEKHSYFRFKHPFAYRCTHFDIKFKSLLLMKIIFVSSNHSKVLVFSTSYSCFIFMNYTVLF